MPVSATARQGTPADAIDGVVPGHVVQPASPEDLAGTLAALSRDGARTVLRGGGTKLGWGRTPASIDCLVDTTRLDRLIAHRHGDMTATVQAGASLVDTNRALAAHGQYLPIDTAFGSAATIGGAIATNDSGPLRHRYGTPRDLLIGITLALTDGRLVKAGGTVVKNVAGYDLGKLMSGSHGTLAAIVDATFKLLPIPLASTTLVAGYARPDDLARDAAALAASQAEPTALDVRVTGAALALLVRLASSPAATAAQVDAVARLLSVPAARVSGDEERAVWSEQVALPWTGHGPVVRVSWFPADLESVLGLLRAVEESGCRLVAFAGRAGGVGLLQLEGDDAASAGAIGRLRAAPQVGHVILLRGSPALKALVDVWGPVPSAIGMAQALKRTFDPAGILNAGRGPL